MCGEGVPGRHDVGDRAAERLLLVDAGDCSRGRVPVADVAVVVEQDDAVGDVGERARRVGAALGLTEETCVVDGDRGAARELDRQCEVGFRVRRVRLGRDQRQRAQRPAPRNQRHADGRLQPELVDDPPQLLVVADRLVQQLLREFGEEFGLPGAQHVRHSRRRVRVGRVAVLQLVGPAHLVRVLVRDREPLDLAVRADHVDRAPVGKARDAQLRDLPEGVVVVERRGEQLARLGEKGHPLPQRLLGRIEPRAGQRLGGLARERQLHLAALRLELEVAVERERHRAEDAAFDRERDDHDRVALLALPGQGGIARVSLLDGRNEERLAGPDHLRHRHVGREREALPPDHHRGVVPALGEQLDVGAVLAEDADRAGAGFGGLHALGQDRVQYLLRRDRLRQQLRDALESSRSVGDLAALGRGHRSGSVEMLRRS